MPSVARRRIEIQSLAERHLGGERIAFAERLGRTIGDFCRSRRRDRGRKDFLADLVELSDHDTEPLLRRILVVDIAIDTARDSRGTEFLEAGVEILAHLAEIRVVRVA